MGSNFRRIFQQTEIFLCRLKFFVKNSSTLNCRHLKFYCNNTEPYLVVTQQQGESQHNNKAADTTTAQIPKDHTKALKLLIRAIYIIEELPTSKYVAPQNSGSRF
jgi:hypothetical protein